MKTNRPRLGGIAKQTTAMRANILRDFKRSFYREDLIKMVDDTKEELLVTKEQEDMIMDMADAIEPGWHKKYDDKNPSDHNHWLYKFVRTKLFRLLK